MESIVALTSRTRMTLMRKAGVTRRPAVQQSTAVWLPGSVWRPAARGPGPDLG